MTPQEREIMNRHVAYWSDYAVKGIAIAFGPVMDKNGIYGIGLYQVEDEAEMNRLLDNDPAKGLISYDVAPMPRLVLGNLKP
jgi:hypothetical protein